MRRRTANPLLRATDEPEDPERSENSGTLAFSADLALADPDPRTRRVWVEVRAAGEDLVLHEVAGNHPLPTTLAVRTTAELPPLLDVVIGLGPTSDTAGYRVERTVALGSTVSVAFDRGDALQSVPALPARPVYANTKGAHHYQAPGDDE